MRLVWTEPAKRDLALARAWIAQDRPSAAASQVQRIVSTVAGLRDFPSIGRPGRRAGARELVVPGSPFIVAHKVRDDEIEILRVFHGARRWPNSL
ncbi:type II toxin-antitoxin system RelE/ParE family toxin [Caulobacter sp. Root487D2Y]|uniref:type II toxin-antitoxin system RelE/ParE family toxin n=1 Tax=Caulobacter sp. Root487D2Y TaxID=1736547 RepID=UPI0009E920B8|nr:type II toxin-antitoxin system RelE/ParE family toxin [Caulobacter sp. Root487D2Y]